MGEYYFDIETYSTTEKPDPKNDKIITVQFQRLSTEDGQPEDKLQILTEWQYGSEKAMLNEFRRLFITGKDFDFIPIGVNLYGFDLISILHRLNQHFSLNLSIDFFRDRPVIDIKPILVIMNGGKFKGYQDLLGKKESGKKIKELYEAKDYDNIIRYITDEAKDIISKYQVIKKQLPQIKL